MILYSQMLVEEDIFQVEATLTNLSQKIRWIVTFLKVKVIHHATSGKKNKIRRAEPYPYTSHMGADNGLKTSGAKKLLIDRIKESYWLPSSNF